MTSDDARGLGIAARLCGQPKGSSMSKRQNVRALLELESGEFVLPYDIKDKDTATSAFAVVKMQLKDALHGLSPLFTKDALLALCMEVMAEDDNPDGPQTKLYLDHSEEQMAAEE
jgi:hypothetical protein